MTEKNVFRVKFSFKIKMFIAFICFIGVFYLMLVSKNLIPYQKLSYSIAMGLLSFFCIVAFIFSLKFKYSLDFDRIIINHIVKQEIYFEEIKMLIIKNKSTACLVLNGKKAVFLDKNIISNYDDFIKKIVKKLKQNEIQVMGSNEKDFSGIYNVVLIISEILILFFMILRILKIGI